MDTFIEQIVPIKKTKKTITLFLLVWFAALLLCGFAILLFMAGVLGGIMILLLAGIFYGAFKITGKLNVEYEYIITNCTFDIDKIINKASRKRIASFEISTVSRLEKYNASLLNNVDPKNVVFAANSDSEAAYLLVYQKDGKNPVYVVFEPIDKIKSATIKYLPKFIANSAFK